MRKQATSIGKILGISLVCLMIGSLLWALSQPTSAQEEPIAYSFRLPLDGDWAPSQDFNKWNQVGCGYHLAEDVIRNSEVPVYAAADGIVELAKPKSGYGYIVIIQHKLPSGDPDGDYVCTLYGHLREEGLISLGAVAKGDRIGYLSSNPEYNGGFIHLHFGIRKDSYLGEVNDPGTGHWYYAGYTNITGECDRTNLKHQQILAEWFNPTTDPINGEGFIERHSGRSGGPDSFGYTFIDSNSPGGPIYEWIEISGTGTMILPNSDDIYVEGISVGFFFNFYGTDYSQVSITNNGIVFATGGTGQYLNQPIGSSTPHNFISHSGTTLLHGVQPVQYITRPKELLPTGCL